MDDGHPVETRKDPGVATAEQGQVMLDGPDGVAVAMTPEAAEGTARSLLAAVEIAKQQQPDS